MPTIIDMHTHAQDVQNPAHLRRPLKALRRVVGRRGPIWIWERLRYTPGLAGRAAGPFAVLTALETQLRLTYARPDRLVAAMVRAGVGRAVVLPIEPLSDSDEAIAMGREHPEVVPFAGVDPRTPGAADRLDRLLRAGAKGLKLHPILQETPPDDEAWHPLVEVAIAHKVPILTHTGSYRYTLRSRPSDEFGCPSRFEPLLRAFPGQPFILGHTGLHERDDAIALATRFDNVVLETSFQHRSAIRRALRAVGPDRVVFGSDWPNSDIRVPLAEARAAAATDGEAEKILWKNAERLLGIA